jgi:hypothetical protein
VFPAIGSQRSAISDQRWTISHQLPNIPLPLSRSAAGFSSTGVHHGRRVASRRLLELHGALRRRLGFSIGGSLFASTRQWVKPLPASGRRGPLPHRETLTRFQRRGSPFLRATSLIATHRSQLEKTSSSDARQRYSKDVRDRLLRPIAKCRTLSGGCDLRQVKPNARLLRISKTSSHHRCRLCR